MDQCQASRERYVIRLHNDECPLVAYVKDCKWHVYKELSPWLCDTLWLWMRCMKIYADPWYILWHDTDMQRTERHGTRENDKCKQIEQWFEMIWRKWTSMNQPIRVDHRDKLVTPSRLFPDQLHRDIRIGAHICSCLLDQNAWKRESPDIYGMIWQMGIWQLMKRPKIQSAGITHNHMEHVQNCLYTLTARCDSVIV